MKILFILLLLLTACDSPAQPMPVDASVPDAAVPDASAPELAYYVDIYLYTEAGDEVVVTRTNMNEYFVEVNGCSSQYTPEEFVQLRVNMWDLNEVSW